MKIVFLGTPPFVDPVLRILEEKFDIVLSVRDPKDFNKEKVEEIKLLQPDLFVVASFGVILPKGVLEIPKFGAINIHPSLLPKYRGPSPIQTAILNGDKTTGVCIIKMDEEVDHGPILYEKEEEVLPEDTFESLAKRLFGVATDALPETISNYVANTLKLAEQDHSKATFTKHLTRQSGYISPEKPPQKDKINRMIRAYFSWPGVWTKYNLGNNEKVIKFLPGEKIQVEGKKEMRYVDLINGYPEGKELLDKLSLI